MQIDSITGMSRVVTFGEIMLRLSPPGYLRFSQASSFEAYYGGSESNVAISLANFRIPTDFVTRLPENELGEVAIMDIRKHGVGTNHILRGGERIGIYFLENGAVSRGSQVIYDRSNSSMCELRPGMIDWKVVLKGATWFHWSGITPAISQSAADVCLEAVTIANEMGLTISADLNFRAKLWKYCSKPQMIARMAKMTALSHIILCAKEDADTFYGISPEPGHAELIQAFKSIAKQVTEKFSNLKMIIATQRGSVSASHNSLSGWLFNKQSLLQTHTYQITHIVDRVGGGDAFMAGIIYGLITYKDDQKALDFAVAASCLKHTIQGDTNLVSVFEVEKLMLGDGTGRIRR